ATAAEAARDNPSAGRSMSGPCAGIKDSRSRKGRCPSTTLSVGALRSRLVIVPRRSNQGPLDPGKHQFRPPAPGTDRRIGSRRREGPKGDIDLTRAPRPQRREPNNQLPPHYVARTALAPRNACCVLRESASPALREL